MTAADQMASAAAEPVWLSAFCPAGEVTSSVGPRSFLHAGPPIAVKDVTGPSLGGVIAGLIFEGEASNREEAEEIIATGGFSLMPCHSVGGVGALAGIVTPNTPVVAVSDESGRTCFSPLNEGLGKAVRFGNFDSGTIGRLRWMSEVLSPALNAALEATDPIDVLEIQAEGLRRGDECHNRNVACVAQFGMRLASRVVVTATRNVAEAVFRELESNVHFFLSLSIAASKLVADRLHEIAPPGVLTAIAANGRTIGIRVSGAPDVWYETDSHVPRTVALRDGYRRNDANPLLGDSAVAETVGLGASALTASPVLAQRMGLDFPEAVRVVAELRKVALLEHPRYRLPIEGMRGSPFAISIARVVETGITPSFSAGFAHREPGGGPVAAGVTAVPLELFKKALDRINSTAGQREPGRHAR